jgi:hypothetical protein
MQRATPIIPIAVRLLICVAIIAAAYQWLSTLMDTLYAYRSPLSQNPPLPLPAPGHKSMTRQVVVVLIDGLRLDTAANAEIMPFLNELRQQAAWASMHSRPPSYSAPGYSVLFTGAWPELSDGPVFNLPYDEIPTWTQDNLFTAAQRQGFKTAISAYYWFEKLVPQQTIQASFYTPGEDQAADRQVVDAALPWIRQATYKLVLVHLDQVDYAGHHQGGPHDPRWNEAARRSDDLLRELVAQMDLSQDTLLVLSDHGHIDAGGHGGHDPVTLVEPFVLVGRGILPGKYADIQMVDIAPTLTTLLGASQLASAQGRPLLEMLALSAIEKNAILNLLHSQQTRLLFHYTQAIHSPVDPFGPGSDPVGAGQALLEQARTNRLNQERLPRLILATFLVLVPLAWLLRHPARQRIWLLISALLFLALFHLGYAIIAGRTYSFSSVLSASDLILVSSLVTVIALLGAWLLLAIAERTLSLSPSHSALLSLDLNLTILYLLSIFVWWNFALNGALIGWTLPNFPSLFLGFLALGQMIFVAAAGLVLAGLGAVVARISARRNV